MRFEFAAPARIVVGEGVAAQLPTLVREVVGSPGGTVTALLVVGSSMARTATIHSALEAEGVECTVVQVIGEPTVNDARLAVERLRDAAAEVVIAVGGGSVIDSGKATSAIAANEGDVLDYLEVIGRGARLTQPSVPVIAVPTTAGSGAEVTRNAVLASPDHAVKVSLRSALLLPKVAVVDPELTYSMPAPVTASTGLDALTQVIEPFVSPLANPITDAFARDGIARAARSLRRAYEQGEDVEARRDMALASLLGGLALANAKLGAVHGLAGVIGGATTSPHGAVCARLLPFVMEANLAALRRLDGASPAVARFGEVGRLVTGRSDATAEDGVRWVRELCAELAVRPLHEYGVRSEDLPAIVDQAARASSTKGNPVDLGSAGLFAILEAAL